MIRQVATVAVYVENQEQAKAFWRDKVGFEVRNEQSMGSIGSWLEVAPKAPSYGWSSTHGSPWMTGRSEGPPLSSSAKTSMAPMKSSKNEELSSPRNQRKWRGGPM